MTLLTPTRQRVIPSPSAGLWPGLFNPPVAPLHAKAARALIQRAVRKMPVSLVFPDGTRWGAGGPELQIARPDAFFARLGRDGLIGLGEAWMTGELTAGGWLPSRKDLHSANPATDTLAAALTVLATRMEHLVPAFLQKLRALWDRHTPNEEENTEVQARQNIHRHYDLSNDLFELFLDPTMSYSAAWFEPGTDTSTVDLETAQYRKIDGVLDLARVGHGASVLEIGSGWGALAIRAAADRGAEVTTLTLSTEQKEFAERRIAEAGLANRITVRLEDYRAHAAANPGKYHSVVSVEMIEAVGEKFWPDYFGAIDRVLQPGGRMGLQAITIDHDRLMATRHSYTWIHKYIFPGGILPSLTAIDRVLAPTTLRVAESRRLGPSYVTTLQQWRHTFNDNLEKVYALGFDETFTRMWNFYLAYTQAGFAAEYIDDWQLGLARM
ncbi:SAM-dependent methyltransferase [Nakamurella lactea]|uniref:SAM-dependent methyltransferase n=1 Tax=Nakamurella lactea TaxID=459515 RepID=UPI0003F6473D|nr:cyclopropane-fatty-acyl-phospholipid synthase family protein [Nakamurella lactea]